MSNWLERALQAEGFMAKKRLQENQRNSLLQEFMDYENRPQAHQQLLLQSKVVKNGDLHISLQFNGEKTFDFFFRDDKRFEVQNNPSLLISPLFDCPEFIELNEIFCRYMGTEKELLLLREKTNEGKESQERLCERLGERASRQTLQDLDDWNRIAEEMDDWIKEKDRMLYDTPFLAERLDATYRAFLAQRSIRVPESGTSPVDPVEADLEGILKNEKLSAQTKAKARSLLHAYREQKSVKEEKEVESAEQEANLILSTIEQHYVKGGSRE